METSGGQLWFFLRPLFYVLSPASLYLLLTLGCLPVPPPTLPAAERGARDRVLRDFLEGGFPVGPCFPSTFPRKQKFWGLWEPLIRASLLAGGGLWVKEYFLAQKPPP